MGQCDFWEQRYQAVSLVIHDAVSVVEVAC